MTQEKLENYIKENFKQMVLKRPIKTGVQNLSWLFKDRKNFVSLSTMMQSLPNHFYSSSLVKHILHQFWKPVQHEIIKK